jgi:hypothetical protein
VTSDFEGHLVQRLIFKSNKFKMKAKQGRPEGRNSIAKLLKTRIPVLFCNTTSEHSVSGPGKYFTDVNN